MLVACDSRFEIRDSAAKGGGSKEARRMWSGLLVRLILGRCGSLSLPATLGEAQAKRTVKQGPSPTLNAVRQRRRKSRMVFGVGAGKKLNEQDLNVVVGDKPLRQDNHQTMQSFAIRSLSSDLREV